MTSCALSSNNGFESLSIIGSCFAQHAGGGWKMYLCIAHLWMMGILRRHKSDFYFLGRMCLKRVYDGGERKIYRGERVQKENNHNVKRV